MKKQGNEAPPNLIEQFMQGVPGIVHDHMHWEDGKLVEDTLAANVDEVTTEGQEYISTLDTGVLDILNCKY